MNSKSSQHSWLHSSSRTLVSFLLLFMTEPSTCCSSFTFHQPSPPHIPPQLAQQASKCFIFIIYKLFYFENTWHVHSRRGRNWIIMEQEVCGQVVEHWYLLCREGHWSFTGLVYRWSALGVGTGGGLWLWLRCWDRLWGPILWDTLHDGGRRETIHIDVRYEMCTIQCIIVTPRTGPPCWECGWGTRRPGPSWGTPDLVFSGHRTRTPPLPGRERYGTRRPTTEKSTKRNLKGFEKIKK